MKRSLLLFGFAIVGLLGVGMLGAGPLGMPVPAAAADGFTLDPTEADGQIATQGERAEFTGKLVPEETSGIYAFVDEKLLTCEDYFGNELNVIDGCWRIASIEGSSWSFTFGRAEIERLGLAYLGPHELRFILTNSPSFDRVVVAEIAIDIEFVDVIPTPTPTPTPEPEPVVAAPPADPPTPPAASLLATGNPSAPSVLSSLRTVTDVMTAPSNLLAAAVVTLVLIMLVGLPSTLLDQTLSENYDRIFGKVSPLVKRATAALAAPALPPWVPITFGLAVASVISVFVDPGFGVNLGSIRLLISVGLALVLEDVLGMLVVRRVLRRTDVDLHPRPEFRFGFLIIILVAVVVSRVVGFEPGLIFGLVIGLNFGVNLALVRDAKVKLVGMAWAVFIGLVGWLGYSLLAGLEGFVPVLAAETFSAVAVSTLSALPIALLPLSGVDGGAIFRWNRWVWAGAYFVGLILFFVVLMPMPFSWGEIDAPLATWVALLVGYSVLAIGLWAWFRFVKPRANKVEEVDAA